jgi:hypothetical protein
MKKILITLSIVALFASCDDATDITQPGELGAGAAFVNVEDLATGIFGIYSTANSTAEISFTSRFTDEVAIGSSHGGQSLNLHEGVLNENSGEAEGIWQGNYRIIFRANTLLAAAQRITPTAGEQAIYDQTVAEALTLRAFAYSRLLAYFGEDLEDEASLGTIVLDFPANASTALPRTTVGDTYDFIFSDLQRAETLFDAAGTSYNRFYVSQRFVQGLRARVANYRGDTNLAASAANAVLSTSTLPATGSVADYRSLWQDTSGAAANEVIFTLDVTLNSGGALGSLFNTNGSSLNDGPVFEMSRSVFNILEANNTSNGDVRRQVYVDITSNISTTPDADTNPRDSDEIVIDKYPGDTALGGLAGGLRNDQKVMRTVEMHFILAEVAIRANDFTEAARQVDLVRNARYTTPVTTPAYTNTEAAYADVLLERRLELFVEGHRYIDIKRLGQRADVGYDRNSQDCSLYQAPLCGRPSTDFETQYMPIPLLEFTGNPAVAGQQNPGY